MSGLLGFLVKYHRLREFLGDSRLAVALVSRKAEAEALLIELFGDPWRPGYEEFAAEVVRLRKLGRACVPALALGLSVPDLPPAAAALVAREVIDFRRGIKPKSTQDKLSAMMARASRRRR